MNMNRSLSNETMENVFLEISVLTITKCLPLIDKFNENLLTFYNAHYVTM